MQRDTQLDDQMETGIGDNIYNPRRMPYLGLGFITLSSEEWMPVL